ncbi:MAG: NADPH-dependent FMN reductase [Acidimicrobiales bacterium]
MSPPITITAIVGSLRRQSFNRAVFTAATELLGEQTRLVEADLGDVPLYNGDVEAEGDPEPVAALKHAVATTDGLIIFTPEYNRGVPAVTKNAVDWLSRTPGASPLAEATVGIVAATPGRHEAAGVRGHLATSITANTDRLYEPTLGLASIGHLLEDGRLTDAETRSRLADWLGGFVQYVKETQHD